MRGRPPHHSDEQLIEKAQDVFWRKGYTATTMGDLLRITGTGSGSFYNTFKGGKKEVYRKAILQRREAFKRFKAALGESESPLELIKDFFRSIAHADLKDHLKGCIIANSVVEMTFVEADLELEAVTMLKEVEEMFAGAIQSAQQSNIMSNQTDPEVLGRYLITFWCGLNTLRRMYPDQETLLRQIELQLAVLD